MIKLLVLFVQSLLLLPVLAQAQSLEAMKQLFPDKMAIFSSIHRSVEIDFKKGVPFAASRQVTELMILDDNAQGIYNKDKVYHSSFNELTKVEAYTLVPEGNTTTKIKVSDFKTQSSPGKGVFYDDSKETSFDYPRMMKGSVAHVETNHYSKDIRFLSTFYFSNYLPAHQSKYSVTYPDDMDIRYIIRNDEKNIVSVKETVKGKKKKLEFTANDVKNYEMFGDGATVPYYGLHVIVYVASYKSNKETIPVFGSIDALYKWNAVFLDKINVSPDEQLLKITDSICVNKKSDREKAQAIFLWVQHHIKYVAFEAGLEGFIPRQAADVCSKRYGDCKDMASILTAMLKIKGLDAYFTWIGTRSIPYSYTEVPLPITDNHMICALRINKAWVFLDATDPNCIFGMPTSGIQGKEALISLGTEQFEVVKVPVMAASVNTITDSTLLTVKDNLVSGNCSVVYDGYFGGDLYNNLQYNKGDDERVYARRRMAKGTNKFIMKDYRVTLTDPANRTGNISATFDIPDYAKSIAGEIYLNLNLEKLFTTTPIDTSKRKVAIEIDHLYTINQVHTLKIPEGYLPDYIPANTVISNDLLDLSIVYKKGVGEISATQQLVMKKLYIQPKDFATWNKVVTIISPAYKEQVVLKKR